MVHIFNEFAVLPHMSNRIHGQLLFLKTLCIQNMTEEMTNMAADELVVLFSCPLLCLCQCEILLEKEFNSKASIHYKYYF